MTAIVDTSFLVSLANANEAEHHACVAVAQTLRERLVVPHVVLPEATYLIDKYLGHRAMQTFVTRMTMPAWTLEPLREGDLARVATILARYRDQRLDFTDAAIIAIAERLRIRRVLTLDRRHFQVIRPQHCPAFELLP